MSDLVPCLDCKKKISRNADKCPYCGSTMHNYLAIFFAMFLVIAMGFVLYWFYG